MAHPSPPPQARCSVYEGIAWLCPHDWVLTLRPSGFELECCVHPRPGTQEHAPFGASYKSSGPTVYAAGVRREWMGQAPRGYQYRRSLSLDPPEAQAIFLAPVAAATWHGRGS